MRVIEHGASGDGKLIVTVFAVKQLLFGFQFDGRRFAANAARTFRPTQTHKQLAALVIGSEHLMNIN
jgi:hypothetical protein